MLIQLLIQVCLNHGFQGRVGLHLVVQFYSVHKKKSQIIHKSPNVKKYGVTYMQNCWHIADSLWLRLYIYVASGVFSSIL